MPKTRFADDQSFSPVQDVQEEKGNYSVITYETRIKLIEKVNNEGYSILKAAKQLEIKPSTAKYIFRCFKKEGRIMKKQQKRKIFFEVPSKSRSENGSITNNSSSPKAIKNLKGEKVDHKEGQKTQNSIQKFDQYTKQKQNQEHLKPMPPMNYWNQSMMKNQFAPIFTPYGYYLTPTGQNMPYMPPMPPMEQPFPIMQNMPPMRMPNAFY